MDHKPEAGPVQEKKQARRWLWLCFLTGVCAVLLAGVPILTARQDARVLLAEDALNPLAGLVAPLAGESLARYEPYTFGQQIPGRGGLSFIFATQAWPVRQTKSSYAYVPLYSASIVIAVNNRGNSAGRISGWRTLLDSPARVLIPQNGTESGRLAAIALARALGAREGDLGLALDAFANLNEQERLNGREEYLFAGYRNAYRPDRLETFDAVVLWDYQARSLLTQDPNWAVVVPEEGALIVSGGYLYRPDIGLTPPAAMVAAYLQSEDGQKALRSAGFAPIEPDTDLSAWDAARLTFNPKFRRQVLSVKRYAPASLQERLLQKAISLLLFCLAAWFLLRRVPPGSQHSISLTAILLIVFWILCWLVKSLPVHADLSRYCWFMSYIPRHFLPVVWIGMCAASRNGYLPSRRLLTRLAGAALALSVLVLSNDIHQLVFVYQTETAAEYLNEYRNGLGYYLSLTWSFSLIVAGLVLLLRRQMARRERLQLLYAGILAAFLLAYQVTYMLNVLPVVDLDIPTTVALLYLLFSLAAQRERFLGASWLTLPILQDSPYAVAVFDGAGQLRYRNEVMAAALPDLDQAAAVDRLLSADGPETDIRVGRRVFKRHDSHVPAGQVVLLEDITEIRDLETRLQQTRARLIDVNTMLARQFGDVSALASRLEQERYARQWDQLFRDKLKNARQSLASIDPDQPDDVLRQALRAVRLRLFICQHRLRLIIRSLEEHPELPASLVARYATGLVKDGRRVGLDGVATARAHGMLPPDVLPLLVETIDRLCLASFAWPGTSLVLHLESDQDNMTLTACLALENGSLTGSGSILDEALLRQVHAAAGQASQNDEEDCLRVQLSWNREEGAR